MTTRLPGLEGTPIGEDADLPMATVFETLLVPLDGSSTAEVSLPHAKRLALALDAQLVLLRAALAQTLPGFPSSSPNETISAAERYLTPLEAAIRADGIRCRSVVAYGPAAESIVDNVELQRADLVVMSARGRSDSIRWGQGNVAAKVVGGLRAPTLIVQERDSAPSNEGILVPLDGSKQAESALAPIGHLAARLGIRVVLLAISPPGGDRGRAIEYVGRIAERQRQRGVETSTEVRVGDPSREIVERAREGRLAMIAISTAGQAEEHGWLLRTVADRVLHEARQSVLLFHAPVAERLTRRAVKARCCHNCGREIYRRALSLSDLCPRCGFVLRSCANCANYDGIVCQMDNPWNRGFVVTSCGDFRFRQTLVLASAGAPERPGERDRVTGSKAN